MKLSHIIILCIAIASLAIGGTLLWFPQFFTQKTSTQSYETPIPTYTSTYTPDQVIAIVQAQYPACYKSEIASIDASGVFRHRTVNTPTSISATYIGGFRGKWKIIVSCPFSYRLYPSSSAVKVKLYFYEDDGSLAGPYKP